MSVQNKETQDADALSCHAANAERVLTEERLQARRQTPPADLFFKLTGDHMRLMHGMDRP